MKQLKCKIYIKFLINFTLNDHLQPIITDFHDLDFHDLVQKMSYHAHQIVES